MTDDVKAIVLALIASFSGVVMNVFIVGWNLYQRMDVHRVN